MTHDTAQAGETPAIAPTPTKWFPCGGLGCLWGPSLAGDFDSPEAVLAAMPERERDGWTVAAGDIWCPHHEDSGRLKALRGCDECTMPGGKHNERCARLLAEQHTGLTHAEAVKRDPVWMSSNMRRLQDELRAARSVLSALLLPTGHLMGEGEVCTPECQSARRIAGVTYDERHLPLDVTVTPPPFGVQLVQSLADIEGGLKRGHVTVIGAPLSGIIPRHPMQGMMMNLEDAGSRHQTLTVEEVERVLRRAWLRADERQDKQVTDALQRIAKQFGILLLDGKGLARFSWPTMDYEDSHRALRRVARAILGDKAAAATGWTAEGMWSALAAAIGTLLVKESEHAQMERRLDAMAQALTEAVEAERTARAAVRLARSDLSGAYVWQGSGALDALAIKKPVIMSADTCRELLHAAVAAGQGGQLAGDIADIIRARTLLGLKPGAPMTPVVEGLREVFRRLSDSHLELHDWLCSLEKGATVGLEGAGARAFEDIGSALKSAIILMGGGPYTGKA